MIFCGMISSKSHARKKNSQNIKFLRTYDLNNMKNGNFLWFEAQETFEDKKWKDVVNVFTAF